MVSDFVSPEELLAAVDDYDQVTWKSDIDGLDVHVLVQHWDVIDDRCDTLWFEFDPPSTLGDRDDVGRLVEAARPQRPPGRRLRQPGAAHRDPSEPGKAVATGLRSLVAWFHDQREGHVTVPYVDLWAYSDSHRAIQ